MIELTAEIVSAHLSNNAVSAGEVPNLIQQVYDALVRTATPPAAAAAPQEPAVSVRASVKPDYIVCLEDGAKLKMLKRYLRTRYDMSPEEYRAKWNLPADYPMVAPAYAEQRRTLAHAIGLGRKKVADGVAAVADAGGKAVQAVEEAGGKAVHAVGGALPGGEDDKPARKPRGARAKAAAKQHLEGSDA